MYDNVWLETPEFLKYQNVYNNSANVADEGLYGSFMDSFLGSLWNDLTGKTAQNKEFAQQEYLQDKMNRYNLPSEQMSRLKDAGINLNTAAAGIAGSGTESAQAPQVSSNTQGVQAGLNSAANLVSSLTSGAASVAAAAKDFGTLPSTIENLDADTQAKLKSLGLTDSQITALDIDNSFRDSEWQKKLKILDLQADDYSEQWSLMNSQWSLNMQKINESLKQIEFMDAQAGEASASAAYLDKLKEKTDFEAQWMKIRIDFWKDRGFDILGSSRDMAIVQMIENGKDVHDLVNTLIKFDGERNFEMFKQQFLAEQKFQAAQNLYNGLDKLVRFGISGFEWLNDSSKVSRSKYRSGLKELRNILEDKIDSASDVDTRKQMIDMIDGINVILSLSNSELDEYRSQPAEFRKF